VCRLVAWGRAALKPLDRKEGLHSDAEHAQRLPRGVRIR